MMVPALRLIAYANQLEGAGVNETATTDMSRVRVLVYSDSGPVIARERDANDLLSDAWGQNATLVAVPVSRLGEDFFKLATGLAGAIAQKFVNYQLRLAIVGDISAWTADSRALRDFVYEANHGRALWFVGSMDELAERLRQETSAAA